MDHRRDDLDRLNENPLYKTLGLIMEEAGQGKATSTLTPNPDVCWPFPGQPHGGILFTQMDTTMAIAVFSALKPGHNCATIHLDIHYPYPARGPAFVCKAWMRYRTSRLSFVNAEIFDKEDRLVAAGQATFRLIKSDAMSHEGRKRGA